MWKRRLHDVREDRDVIGQARCHQRESYLSAGASFKQKWCWQKEMKKCSSSVPTEGLKTETHSRTSDAMLETSHSQTPLDSASPDPPGHTPLWGHQGDRMGGMKRRNTVQTSFTSVILRFKNWTNSVLTPWSPPQSDLRTGASIDRLKLRGQRQQQQHNNDSNKNKNNNDSNNNTHTHTHTCTHTHTNIHICLSLLLLWGKTNAGLNNKDVFHLVFFSSK